MTHFLQEELLKKQLAVELDFSFDETILAKISSLSVSKH